MADSDNPTEGQDTNSTAPAKNELGDDDLERVAGGGATCTPDDPATILPDDSFTPFNPMR